MASSIRFPSSPFLTLFLITLFPLTHSLSTVAISKTSDQTLVCSVSQIQQRFLNCSIFPQRIQFQLTPVLSSVSGVVAGDGFVCALSSFHRSSRSVVVCWRFPSFGTNTTYSRVYNGPLLKEFSSGNSHVCGLVAGSNSLRCWQWRGFNRTVSSNISSSLAVGEDFICGLSDSGRAECSGTSGHNVFDEMPQRNFSLVNVGFRHACGVSIDGALECWGNATNAGSRPNGEFTLLALGENRSCSIRSNNGTVICWGENGFALPGSLLNEPFISLEAKRSVFCGVLMSNYSLVCWGNEGFDSNPLVHVAVLPGPCRPRNECACDNFLPNYQQYCDDQGLTICRPCVQRTIIPLAPSVPPPPSSGGKTGRSGRTIAFFVVGCVGSFLSLLFVCIFLFSRYINIRGSRIHDSGRLEEGPPDPHLPPPALERKISHLLSIGNGGNLEEFPLQILLEATENFSETHKIGSGSFGSVYDATLADGRRVAVKRADPTKQGQEEKDSAFLNELEFLSRLNHKNLVRLLGFCEESNERVLVYEHMENGTLFDHLHNNLPNSPLFSWVSRIACALDAARGVEYLHEYAVPRVIHRDIKSSNILLDATWAARVSDFGLSLAGPDEEDESHLSMVGAGTMGYVDPEYYRLQVLTKKSDVYSFGVVLLEMLTGRKAIHEGEDGGPRSVVDYVGPYVGRDELHRVLDRRVPSPTPYEIEGVVFVGCIAADCVEAEGRRRPAMREVVRGLSRALEACLDAPAMSRSTTTSSTG